MRERVVGPRGRRDGLGEHAGHVLGGRVAGRLRAAPVRGGGGGGVVGLGVGWDGFGGLGPWCGRHPSALKPPTPPSLWGKTRVCPISPRTTASNVRRERPEGEEGGEARAAAGARAAARHHGCGVAAAARTSDIDRGVGAYGIAIYTRWTGGARGRLNRPAGDVELTCRRLCCG